MTPSHNNRMIDQACVYTAEETLARLLMKFGSKKDRLGARADVLAELNRIHLHAENQGFKTRDILSETTSRVNHSGSQTSVAGADKIGIPTLFAEGITCAAIFGAIFYVPWAFYALTGQYMQF